MIKLFLISISLVLSILLLSSISFFEQETHAILKMDKKNVRFIRKLKKISRIGTWLDEYVKPFIISTPQESQVAEENLVQYFDRYAQEFHLKVNQYIYTQDNIKFLDVSFQVDRDNKRQLNGLSQIHYPTGFLQINTLKVKDNTINGTIHIIQPYKSIDQQSEESQEDSEDDVPQ